MCTTFTPCLWHQSRSITRTSPNPSCAPAALLQLKLHDIAVSVWVSQKSACQTYSILLWENKPRWDKKKNADWFFAGDSFATFEPCCVRHWRRWVWRTDSVVHVYFFLIIHSFLTPRSMSRDALSEYKTCWSLSQVSHRKCHAGNATPEMSRRKCHAGNVTPEMSRRKCHAGNVTPEMSRRKCHAGNVTPEMSRRKCHTGNVTPASGGPTQFVRTLAQSQLRSLPRQAQSFQSTKTKEHTERYAMRPKRSSRAGLASNPDTRRH